MITIVAIIWLTALGCAGAAGCMRYCNRHHVRGAMFGLMIAVIAWVTAFAIGEVTFYVARHY